jgi:hypothetical protein
MPASTDTESYRFSLGVPTISPSPNTDARAIRSQCRDESDTERAATEQAQKHRRLPSAAGESATPGWSSW